MSATLIRVNCTVIFSWIWYLISVSNLDPVFKYFQFQSPEMTFLCERRAKTQQEVLVLGWNDLSVKRPVMGTKKTVSHAGASPERGNTWRRAAAAMQYVKKRFQPGLEAEEKWFWFLCELFYSFWPLDLSRKWLTKRNHLTNSGFRFDFPWASPLVVEGGALWWDDSSGSSAGGDLGRGGGYGLCCSEMAVEWQQTKYHLWTLCSCEWLVNGATWDVMIE